MMPRDVMTTAEASEYLRIPAATLARWRSDGTVRIPFARFGRLVRYRRQDLDRWMARNLIAESMEDRG